MQWRMRSFLAFALLVTACGESATHSAPPIATPDRTAAQDRAVRALIADIAEHRVCSILRDRFVPLPEDRPLAQRRVTEGRLWVSGCRAERTDRGLSLHLEGRGWQWVERTGAGPVGSAFTVRGTVRVETTLDLSTEVDVRYDDEEHRVLLALTPTDSPRARVTPIGSIPVAPSGGWSSIVGGIGGLFGLSPEAQARPLLEEQAALTIERELARGATLSLGLCSSQLDVVLGPIGDEEAMEPPPYPGNERWVDNARVRLHRGGLDLSGPWDTAEGDGIFDLTVESGGPVMLAVICRPEAAIVASSFLAGGPPQTNSPVARQSVRQAASVALRAADCAQPHVLLTSDGEATVRYRVRRDGLAPQALVDCD